VFFFGCFIFFADAHKNIAFFLENTHGIPKEELHRNCTAFEINLNISRHYGGCFTCFNWFELQDTGPSATLTAWKRQPGSSSPCPSRP
jgi:hypothetical protein